VTASTSVSVRRTVSLRAAGVSLVLDLSDDLLPAVVHWGADLGSLTTEDEAAALTYAGVNPVGLNQVDEPVRVAILPEESCSSGGGRVDLEVIERTDRVWTSDCIDPHERQLMHRWTQQLLPPELMGAHIASGISHTTGRGHSLEYRASTAVFGHLGIEWDLRAAPADELAHLGAWVTFYKHWRSLLHTGDVVRLDAGDETLFGHGVVSRDRSRALFAIAAVERSMTSMYGRVRLRGLDAGCRYRVRPVLPAGELAGMLPPPWWGTGAGDIAAHSAVTAERIAGGSGAVFSGQTLERVGVAHPAVFPDTTVLYEIEAVGSSGD